MCLEIQPMSEFYAREVVSWRYSGELSVYSCDDFHEFLNGAYYSVTISGKLIGFYCIGKSAQVPGYQYDESCRDLGLGMRPDLVGKELGRSFTEWGLRRFRTRQKYRLTVRKDNNRALRVYRDLGFEIEDMFLTETGVEFWILKEREMEWMEVSRTLAAGMDVYPGDPPFQGESNWEGECRLSVIRMGTHCGTHIDAPAHYVKDGRQIGEIPMEKLNGTCRVMDQRNIMDTPVFSERILLKTYRGLSKTEALTLVRCGVGLVGVDRLSVGDVTTERTIHEILLKANIVILENLELAKVKNGFYQLNCLPIRLDGFEAAPVRAILGRRR